MRWVENLADQFKEIANKNNKEEIKMSSVVTAQTEIEVTGVQKFLGKEIPVIEGGFGQGQKVMLAKTIAEIHEVELKEINRIINNNLHEFEYGIDILDLKQNGDYKTPLEELGFSNRDMSISKNIYLLSEQGYMALVSLMRTDKAKEIRRKLRREYFAMRKEIKQQTPQFTDDLLIQFICQLPQPQIKKIIDKLSCKLLPPKPVVDVLYDSLKDNLQFLSYDVYSQYVEVDSKVFYDYFEKHGHEPSTALKELHARNLVQADIYGFCTRNSKIVIKMKPSLEFYECD